MRIDIIVLMINLYIGWSYFGLAKREGKNKIGFVIFGIVMFYLGALIGEMIVLVYSELMNVIFRIGEGMKSTVIQIPLILHGCIFSWIVFRVLKGKLNKP